MKNTRCSLDSLRSAYMYVFPLLLLLLLVTIEPLCAENGSLISVEHEQFYSAEEVNASASRLFSDENGEELPSADYGVDIYGIRFESTDLDGGVVEIFARLFVPRLDGKEPVPLYVFGAGTTGLTNSCRTSREHELGINWGLYRSHMLAHAGQGVIGVLPDYMHFSDSDRLQPYFIPDAEGRVMLDAVRASRAIFGDGPASQGEQKRQDAQGSSQVHVPLDTLEPEAAEVLEELQPAEGALLAGFSQGGHAIFAAADIASEYAPEIEIAGLIGYGATTNIEQLFREFTVVAAPIIYTYSRHYGEEQFDPEKMLQERWLENLSTDVRRLCILGLQDYYPWNPKPLFTPKFYRALRNRELSGEFPDIHAVLQENSTGLTGHKIPALILQGGDDVVINLEEQANFVGTLRDRGSDVRYIVYPGHKHDTRQIGFSEAQEWMHARTEE
ncbi:MAG: alpha/beta hydrolase [Spirochaetia bacterium]